MKRLILLAVLGLAACGDSGDNRSDPDEVVEEAADEVYESVSDTVRRPLDEAAEVEAVLEERAEEARRAIEDQSEG